MLYATTRNKNDPHTPERAILDTRAPDGGFYIPMEEPSFTPEQIGALKDLPFNQTLVKMLNYLFDAKLTTWDLDFTVGRRPIRLRKLSQKLVMAECWRNTGWDFRRMVRDLAHKLTVEDRETYGDWADIGVRIAVLFGIFGELQRMDIPALPLDVSVTVTDFSGVMALWYGKKWGLPIRNIICSCTESSGLWDLFHQGELRTDAVSTPSSTPDGDTVIPDGLERLIAGAGEPWEVERFVETCRRGDTYVPGELAAEKLPQGLYVSVISDPRMMRTIPSAYATHKYLLSPYTALSYAGLLDYRAKTGQNHYGLILADRSPSLDADTVARAMGLDRQGVQTYLDQL